MKELLIVIASQDFENANHKGLWIKLSQKCDVLVSNIPADLFTSIVTGKGYRLKETRKKAKAYSNRLKVFRPLLILRPEIAPQWMSKTLAKHFWKQVAQIYPNLDEYYINVLVYDGCWIKMLKSSRDNLKFAYYLFDEVRSNGRDGSQNTRRTSHDDFACRNADFMITMTKLLADSREQYSIRKIVIGNGADLPKNRNESVLRIQDSVAFIGNIRDWIDQDLLECLISRSPQWLFAFVGPVEENMKTFLNTLLNNYSNTAYFGKVGKDRITDVYRMFKTVIIPYKSNDFIRASRPIKIVESVFAGTPVVTVPVNGYEETPFIRFASDADSFNREIQYCMEHDTIDERRTMYNEFIADNTWENKARIILNAFFESRVGL